MATPRCRGGWGRGHQAFSAPTVPVRFAGQQPPPSLPSSRHPSLAHGPRKVRALAPFCPLPSQVKVCCAGVEREVQREETLHRGHAGSWGTAKTRTPACLLCGLAGPRGREPGLSSDQGPIHMLPFPDHPVASSVRGVDECPLQAVVQTNEGAGDILAHGGFLSLTCLRPGLHSNIFPLSLPHMQVMRGQDTAVPQQASGRQAAWADPPSRASVGSLHNLGEEELSLLRATPPRVPLQRAMGSVAASAQVVFSLRVSVILHVK